MKTYKYIILGGGIAGGRASESIRRVDAEGDAVIVAGESHRPYQRPPLSKGYMTGEEGLDKVYLRDQGYYEQKGVELIQGVYATKLDPSAHQVTLGNGEVLGYQKLLLATGGRAKRLPIPGSDLPNVFALRTIEDAQAICYQAQQGKQALILGGSFIGAEVAASLAQRGLSVTMVFPESRLLEVVMPAELDALLSQKYADHGVRILTATKPVRLEGRDKAVRAVLDTGEVLPVDLVVMGVGIALNTELAEEAGLALDEQKAVLVDEYLRTSDKDIYAAGDVASWPSSTFDKRLQIEHWDVARTQGLRAGRNMAGEAKPYTTLPYFFTDLFDLSFEAWGDLAAWDRTVMRGGIEGGRFALYYFRNGTLAGVLTRDRPDEEREVMQQLVHKRVSYQDIADKLRDEGADLSSLVE